MSGTERERLRERVASGTASAEEIDRLAGSLAAAIRARAELSVADRAAMTDELEALADQTGQPGCVDALLGVLLDRQIRAFERRDAPAAWAALDSIRAWAIARTPSRPLIEDRLAAALFNAHRGGELLDDPPMRLAALEELRTRAEAGPCAPACRLALAELLADAVTRAAQADQREPADRSVAELERLRERELGLGPGLGVASELARALRELARAGLRPPSTVVAELDALVTAHAPGPDDPLRQRLAESLVIAHAAALRADDELIAERLRERLRASAVGHAGAHGVHELGQALHDAAVLGYLGERPARALTELRALVDRWASDDELRAQLMSALFQIHRHAIEAGALDHAERLQAEADALLAAEAPEPEPEPDARAAPPRSNQARLELRLDYLRMLLASHALAGDRGDWDRARRLLGRARAVVVAVDGPLPMVEVLGQMLVNAQVDAGVAAPELTPEPAPGAALLDELRELARARPHSPMLQLHLATALFNAHVEAGRRGAWAVSEPLLAELDRLHADHPGQLELRRRWAMALVNHHGDCLEREQFERASALLDRLRALARSPDADNQLRMQLAMALGNTLGHADDPDCLDDAARIVGELRVLAARDDASDSLRALILDELSDRFAPRQ